MSLPQHANLPKPPPKALPGARGPLAVPPMSPTAIAHAAPPGRPTPIVAKAAAPTPVSAPTSAKPVSTPTSAKPVAATGGAAKPSVTARTMPSTDIRTLPANLGPMVEAIHIYDELLTEENAALKAGNAKGVEALLDRKMAATRLYQERLRALLADPQCTRSMAPERRNEVIAMVKCLEERAKENTTLLKANMGAIEQLFEVINTAARKMRHLDVAYSKAGMICDTYNRNGVSLAYNHTI